MRVRAFVLVACLTGVATSPAETLLIADKSADRLLVFDTHSGKVTRSIQVGRNPHEVAPTRDGRLAFTANSRSNTVSVVDLKAKKELKRLESPLFKYPHGMAIHPDGETLYLTSEQERLLIFIDVKTLQITGSVGTEMDGSHMVVLSPNGERAYLTNRESGSVTMLETAAPHALKHSTAGDGAEGIALSPGGRFLLAANRNDNDVHIFDAEVLGPVGRVPVGEGPVRATFAPDGRRALVSHRASGQVQVMELVERKITARIEVGQEPGGIVFSSDGKTAFVANTGEGTLSVLDMDSLKVVATHPAGEGPDGMALLR